MHIHILASILLGTASLIAGAPQDPEALIAQSPSPGVDGDPNEPLFLSYRDPNCQGAATKALGRFHSWDNGKQGRVTSVIVLRNAGCKALNIDGNVVWQNPKPRTCVTRQVTASTDGPLITWKTYDSFWDRFNRALPGGNEPAGPNITWTGCPQALFRRLLGDV